jgi:ferric-dicitrate binding protein FerR (iron transport regulator)
MHRANPRREAMMPNPAKLADPAHMRSVRRWTIGVALFYAVTALVLVTIAAVQPTRSFVSDQATAALRQN